MRVFFFKKNKKYRTRIIKNFKCTKYHKLMDTSNYEEKCNSSIINRRISENFFNCSYSKRRGKQKIKKNVNSY